MKANALICLTTAPLPFQTAAAFCWIRRNPVASTIHFMQAPLGNVGKDHQNACIQYLAPLQGRIVPLIFGGEPATHPPWRHGAGVSIGGHDKAAPWARSRDAALPNAACTVTVALNQAGFFNLEGCVTFDSRLLPRRSNLATWFTHCKLEPGWRSSATWVLSSAPSRTLRAKLTPVKTKICSEEISKHWPFFPIATDFLHFFAAKVLPCFWQNPCSLIRHSFR